MKEFLKAEAPRSTDQLDCHSENALRLYLHCVVSVAQVHFAGFLMKHSSQGSRRVGGRPEWESLLRLTAPAYGDLICVVFILHTVRNVEMREDEWVWLGGYDVGKDWLLVSTYDSGLIVRGRVTG